MLIFDTSSLQMQMDRLRSKAGFALLATSQNEIDGGGHNGKM